EVQAAALRSALGLEHGAAGGDRFTTCAGLLSLLGAAAEKQPLLALVDDAQWIDRSSLQAVLFAARRLEAESVAMLIAGRTGGQTLETRGLEELVLAGIEADAAAGLLERAGRPIPRATVEEIVAATAGNPLALLEVPSLLTAQQLAGEEPLDGP